jgi:hypothetical protein
MMNISFINLMKIMPLAEFHEWELKLTWYKTEIAK